MNRQSKGNLERRFFNLSELRMEGTGEARRIIGHAAVFNTQASIFNFREQVAPGAFSETIGTDDVRALFNHNPDWILGRNTAGTLILREDERGLYSEIIPPDTQAARDLLISIDRGDISQMSFGFVTLSDKWERDEQSGTDLRTLLKVRLYDVSPVTYPAYEETDVALRSHEAWSKTRDKPAEGFDLTRLLTLNLNRISKRR